MRPMAAPSRNIGRWPGSAFAPARLSLGLEGGVVGNEEYDAGRGGGFLRVSFRDFETTLSGGFTGNYLEDDPSFYLALGLYWPF
jgi:hypothetical protein